MQLKEKIKFTNSDINIKINISSNSALDGLQQEINRFKQVSTSGSINNAIDAETIRYTYNSTNDLLSFYFWDSGNTNYNNSFLNAGFTNTEITQNNETIYNSYFIMDLYDSFSSKTQNKILTTYITNFNSILSTSYTINNNLSLYKLPVPNNIVNSGITNITGYTRFSFFNAKLGKVQLFYNKNKENYTTEDKYYFETNIDLTNKIWLFPSNILAYEIKYTDNSQYITKYNNTYNLYKNLQQPYPTGTTFNYQDAKYYDISGNTII